MNPPKHNPLTGTVVMEPPAAAPKAPPSKPAITAGAPHPLDRTMMIEPPAGDRTMPLPDEPPKTQAVPSQPASLRAPFPVASPHRPPAQATPAPWQQVREDVSPAADARWSTLIVEPPAAPPPAPPPKEAPAPTEEAAPAIEDLLPPSDPWGARLNAEAQAPEPAPPAAPIVPETSETERVVERKNEVRNSVYGRFKPRA